MELDSSSNVAYPPTEHTRFHPDTPLRRYPSLSKDANEKQMSELAGEALNYCFFQDSYSIKVLGKRRIGLRYGFPYSEKLKTKWHMCDSEIEDIE